MLRDLIGVPSETEAEALLKENNELLKQLIVEVRKVLREMETMNEMTGKGCPTNGSRANQVRMTRTCDSGRHAPNVVYRRGQPKGTVSRMGVF